MPPRRRLTPNAAALPASRLPVGTPQIPTQRSPQSSRAVSQTSQHSPKISAVDVGDTENVPKAGEVVETEDSTRVTAAASSDSLTNLSLAEAKLARQAQRIEKAEAALAAPPLAERQTSRGKGKVWKPFDFTADTDTTAAQPIPSNESGGVSLAAETRINTFRTSTRESSLSRSMSSLSQRTTGTLQSDIDRERQDSSVVDAGGFRLIAGRKNRRNVDQLSVYEDKPEEKQTTVEAKFDPKEIYRVFGNALPGPDFMEQNLGFEDGQLQFVQHPNGDVSAHQWSATRYMWENIGQYSNIRKKIEGQLAADRLKGETASQTLQQNTLAYFRTVAKQREANVTGKPFGAKEIQALMPDLRTAQFAATPKKSVTSAEAPVPPPDVPTIKHEDSVSSTTDSRSQAGTDHPYSYESYPGYTSQTSYSGYGSQSAQQYPYGYHTAYQVPTGPRADRFTTFRPAATSHSTLQDPFYSASSNRNTYGLPSTSGWQAGSYGGYGQSAATVEKQQMLNYNYHLPPPEAEPRQSQNTARSGPDRQYDLDAMAMALSNMRNSGDHFLFPEGTQKSDSTGCGTTGNFQSVGFSGLAARPKPVTPLSGTTRAAMKDQLHKMADSAKERSLSQANIRTVLYDPFRMQSIAEPEPTKVLEPAKQTSPELKRTVANPSGLPSRLQLPAAPSFNTAVGAPRLTPAGSTENLKQSSPDTYWTRRETEVNTPFASSSTYQDQPTPQNFKGPFFGDLPGLPGSAGKKLPPPSKKTYDEELHDWWRNGNTFARQEEFYQRIKNSQKDTSSLNSSSPPSQAPIGTPAKKPTSSLPLTAVDDPMTRLLIPVLENLSAYVQGPVEKRRDYFCQWSQPPEWCIDRSPNGNNSFYDDEAWGQPPARVGRDPRYRPLPVESVRFGGFSSPQEESRLTVGSGLLDRRFGGVR